MAYPSDLKTIRDEVIAELRLEDADASRVDDAINRAYTRGALETEAIQVAATAALTPGVASYTLPSVIGRIKEIKVASADSPSVFGQPLPAVGMPTIVQYQAGDPSGWAGETVQVYAVAGEDEIVVWPTPSTADLMFFWYVKAPDPLVNDADTLELSEPYGTELAKYGACADLRPLVIGLVDGDYRSLYAQAVRDYRVHLSRRRGTGTTQFPMPGRSLTPSSSSADRGF
jgi:hypothetical protein